MRLLHTSNLTLHEFFGDRIPRYAILSHRWENEEVTFQDLRDRKGSQMVGWAKITGCCAQAFLDGCEYIWIDTCCIDKTSSAELSEAINSMFGWYEQAEVCYAYLSDVPSATEDPSLESSSFRSSQWFKRGWTLQELLAPYYVDFFDQNWNWIGSKASLDDVIRDITMVASLTNYKAASVAQKMSWASERVTTRIEDIAYCLLGLFGVHMPPLYGEGKNAFLRLQLEIINKTDDDSIFAWESADLDRSGLLAPAPCFFRESSNIIRHVWDPERPPHTMSSKGLCVHFPLVPNDMLYFFGPIHREHKSAILNCRRSPTNGGINDEKVIALPICQIDIAKRTSVWVRDDFFRLREFDINALDHKTGGDVKRNMLYITQTPGLHTIGGSDGFLKGGDYRNRNFRQILFNFGSLRAIGFGAREYFFQELGDFGSFRIKSFANSLSLDLNKGWIEGKSLASINLANDNLEGLEIVLGVSNGCLWVDLVILDTNEAFQKISDSVSLVEKLLIGRDRISRPFLNGSLNARITYSDDRSERFGLRRVVDVTFDPRGTLRWPVRQTAPLLEFKDRLCITE